MKLTFQFLLLRTHLKHTAPCELPLLPKLRMGCEWECGIYAMLSYWRVWYNEVSSWLQLVNRVTGISLN